MKQSDVIVVGGGIAAMTAASLLASKGHSVRLLEASPKLGGKAGSIHALGAELDTGPSVLTLPEVLFDVFDRVGLPDARFECLELNPGFRYIFPGGGAVLVYQKLERTLASVESSLGRVAREELQAYLSYAERIWRAAAPHFVFDSAPNLAKLLSGGFGTWRALLDVDPFRTLEQAIRAHVKTPELASILLRYATYNGSDARTAPATLGCIAHVELALGGFGVRGGMRSIVRSLEACLLHTGVEIGLGEPVTELLFDGKRAVGVRTPAGRHEARAVVLGADPWQWVEQFPAKLPDKASFSRSMSAHNAIFRSTAIGPDTAPHTVLFPKEYRREFQEIFDSNSLPTDPTLYVAAQDRCHQTASFESGEPLFTMVNAPALTPGADAGDAESTLKKVRDRLSDAGMLHPTDPCLWSRSPQDLAREFPGSLGALYGPASNTMWAAFQRLPNRAPGYQGLYLASGSAHPGGGVPLAAQSGKLAAQLVTESLTEAP